MSTEANVGAIFRCQDNNCHGGTLTRLWRLHSVIMISFDRCTYEAEKPADDLLRSFKHATNNLLELRITQLLIDILYQEAIATAQELHSCSHECATASSGPFAICMYHVLENKLGFGHRYRKYARQQISSPGLPGCAEVKRWVWCFGDREDDICGRRTKRLCHSNRVSVE